MNARVFCSLFLLAPATAAPAAPGDVDQTFAPSPNLEADAPSVQPDGRIVVGGDFSTMGGFSRRRIARLLPDGSVDQGFDPNSNGFIRHTYVMDDGRVLMTGIFTTMGGVTCNRIARVLANGTLDATFNPSANDDTYCTVVQPDGKIVVGGNFTMIAGQSRDRIVRLTTEGALDSSFTATANANVRVILPLPDGKWLIGGNFTAVGTVSRDRLARLLADGTVDAAFNTSVSGPVYSIALQTDGRILIGGSFSTVGGVARANLARLMPDGTLDASHNISVNDIVRTIVVQADGKCLIGGQFSSVGTFSRNRLARLLSTGALDSGFAATAASGGTVFGLALQADGRILIGGMFATIGGLAIPRFARLQNDAVTGGLTVEGNTRIVWLRGGSAPEALRTDFHLSTDGGAVWTPLGAGGRIAGGWELAGMNLPPSGQIRARARTPGGYGGVCGGLVQSLTSYNYDPLSAWRQVNFGTPNATGPAANNADPDKDGLENLVEFGFGLNPNTPDAAALPQWVLDEDVYVLAFTRPAGVSGITYVGEYSTSLAAGSWTPAESVGTPPAYTFLAPATTQRLYLRVRVTVP